MNKDENHLLTLDERLLIEEMVKRGYSGTVIAKKLNRGNSTIGREIKRNGGPLFYNALKAQSSYYDRLKEGTKKKVANSGELLTLEERKTIQQLLTEGAGLSEISFNLERGKTTIVQEVKRNGGKEQYNAVKAQERFETKRKERFESLKNSPPMTPELTLKTLSKRIENLEMQIEILVDVIKELTNGN